MLSRLVLCAAAGAAVFLSLSVRAQSSGNVMHVDATAPVPTPQPVPASLGSARNPEGHTISVNSQYLTLDGKPWLPVMGEFHFSRYPEALWEQEILKMKAAGIDIIATYVIWIHHEQRRGEWHWEGQRDLRRFVELCAKHGMYVYPRVGPWAHGEVRNGGFPDWVLAQGNTRENDPRYLDSVAAFYEQIGKQLHGEMWKDGGPVIGIQIENEYRGEGAGKGSEHIRTLKKLAIAAGLDAPLYTVTGWDGAAIPLDAVLPVFGGYPDAPWDGSDKKLPANEVYAFRFNNRSAGSMGAIGGGGQNAADTYKGTPFLTAEVGDGIQDTYFRRPVVSADDVAAIAPVMLGSGANMLGYYMFHGGRNPDGGAETLQESQRTGYPTDVPEKSYDFQAPLGEFGQESASLRKLKLVHYFLHDFGASLAAMTPRTPDRAPTSPADASIPRVSVRTNGEHGFLFFSNYVRGLATPARVDFQVKVKTPKGEVDIPETPITLPPQTYGIWPVNLDLGHQVTLRYSTAQLIRRVENEGQTYFFFSALPGLVPEFFLEVSVKSKTSQSNAITFEKTAKGTLVRARSSRADVVVGRGIHLILLPEADAENLWRTDDPNVILLTAAYALVDGSTWSMLSTGNPKLELGVFGPVRPAGGNISRQTDDSSNLFARYVASVESVAIKPMMKQLTSAKPRVPWSLGPAVAWRTNRIPLAPDDSDFSGAASWKLTLPALPDSLADGFLKIRYQGDAARIYQGTTLLDDSFWNGVPWTIGLREIQKSEGVDLTLRVLPLPAPFPMYIENSNQLVFRDGRAVSLDSAELIPQYRFVLHSSSIH